MSSPKITQPKFSHVPTASDYMKIAVGKIEKHFSGNLMGKRVLDLPAGNGWVSETLSAKGADAVPADINEAKPEYAQTNMEERLPFDDNSFDAIVCCEGIEHVFSPYNLFSEFARLLDEGGILIITTPNIQSLYSRWQFLCTGYLFQFDPFNKIPLKEGELADKGHISAVSYSQLHYFAEHFGMKPQPPLGGRYKRKLLLPLLSPILAVGYWWHQRDWKKTSGDELRKSLTTDYFSMPLLLSRSLVFSATKPKK